MIRPVLRMGDPLLFQKSLPVTDFKSAELKALLVDMRDTMADLNGAGLAAPQIGVLLRVVIFGVKSNPRYPDVEEVPDTVLINPKLTPVSPELEEGWEGCLSVPDIYEQVERPAHVKLRYLDYNGKQIEEDAHDLFAVCIQHEMDHLDGVLFIDHISRLKRESALRKLKKARLEKADA